MTNVFDMKKGLLLSLLFSWFVYSCSKTESFLLDTKWGQGDHYSNDHYWNYYCPWADSTCTGQKCFVGCVAVAGGQFAYYMRDMPGVLVRIPIEASCNGYVGNYTQTFSSSTSISWIDEMPLNYNDNTAQQEHARIFLAYIGNQIGATYGPTYTNASTSNLPTLLAQWGINTEYVSFNDSLAINQLLAGIPVVTRASTASSGSHSWIIDGYSEHHPLISFNSSSMQNGERSDYPLLIIDQYHMNWGGDGAYDGWYSVSNWTVAGLTFSSGKHMLKMVDNATL